MLKKDLTGTKCNNCGYERQAGDLKRTHRCPKCDQPYLLTRLMAPRWEGYRPNEIPMVLRIYHSLSAAVLFAYGSYGVLVNDLPLMDKKGRIIHLHDVPAWIMYGAILSACVVMLSVVVDHYDRRDNERNYELFAKYGEYVGWSLFVLSFVYLIFEQVSAR